MAADVLRLNILLLFYYGSLYKLKSIPLFIIYAILKVITIKCPPVG